MAFFRFLALILIVLGLMLLGADVISMLESGQEPALRSLENVWGMFTATGVESFKAWLAELVPGGAVDIFNIILGLPAFAVCGVLGILLAVLFRERDEFA